MRAALFFALLLPLAGVAEAPPEVLVVPVATCVEGKCTMSEKDYKALRTFHLERMAALQAAGAMMDDLSLENTELLRRLGRLSAGICSPRI